VAQVNTLPLDLLHAQHALKEHTLQAMLHLVLPVQRVQLPLLEALALVHVSLVELENVGQVQLV